MTSITANSYIEQLFNSLSEATAIRRPSGELLGYFLPVSERDKSLLHEAARQIDPEEMKRRKASSQRGYTFEEVMAHLQSLERDQCAGP